MNCKTSTVIRLVLLPLLLFFSGVAFSQSNQQRSDAEKVEKAVYVRLSQSLKTSNFEEQVASIRQFYSTRFAYLSALEVQGNLELGDFFAKGNSPANSVYAYSKALSGFEKLGNIKDKEALRFNTTLKLAGQFEKNAQADSARISYEQALRIAEINNNAVQVKKAHTELANWNARQGNPQKSADNTVNNPAPASNAVSADQEVQNVAEQIRAGRSVSDERVLKIVRRIDLGDPQGTYVYLYYVRSLVRKHLPIRAQSHIEKLDKFAQTHPEWRADVDKLKLAYYQEINEKKKLRSLRAEMARNGSKAQPTPSAEATETTQTQNNDSLWNARLADTTPETLAEPQQAAAPAAVDTEKPEKDNNRMSIAFDIDRTTFYIIATLIILLLIVLVVLVVISMKRTRHNDTNQPIRTREAQIQERKDYTTPSFITNHYPAEQQLTVDAAPDPAPVEHSAASLNREVLEATLGELNGAVTQDSDSMKDYLRPLIMNLEDMLNKDAESPRMLTNIDSDRSSDFLRRLERKFPNLNERDKQLTSLIHFNLNTTEISNLLKISEDSVVVRLRQLQETLAVRPGEDLYIFVANI